MNGAPAPTAAAVQGFRPPDAGGGAGPVHDTTGVTWQVQNLRGRPGRFCARPTAFGISGNGSGKRGRIGGTRF